MKSPTIGRPGPLPQELLELGAVAEKDAKVAAKHIDRLTDLAETILEGSSKRKAWLAVRGDKWEAPEALRSLLEEVAPEKALELEQAGERSRQLKAAAHSFKSLCSSLGKSWREDTTVQRQTLHRETRAMQGMLEDLDAIDAAVAALGDSDVAKRFPAAQAAALRKKLNADLKVVEAELAKTPAAGVAVRLHDVTKLDDAATRLADRLGDPGLAARITAAAKKLGAAERAELTKDVAALFVLANEALDAPDYRAVLTGEFGLRARSEYRARAYDGWTRYESEPRRLATEEALRAAVSTALDDPQPAAALAKALTTGFLREVGISPAESADWKPTTVGVRAALEAELLLPLRALNEAGVATLTPERRRFAREASELIRDVTRHIAEGDYREWRYSHAASRHQLEGLSAAELASWKDGVSVQSPTPDGARFKTREEDGYELPWVTKIGGPSHGFDVGPMCLLPLLANARTKVILVDDPKWPHNGAARAYLRLIHTTDKKPILYLEPVQSDFPYRGAFYDAREESGYLQLAILSHAIAKAQAMGLPLSVDASLAPFLKHLGVSGKEGEPRYVLRTSGGIFEASDTLPGKKMLHDWPQQDDQVIEPFERLIVSPAKERG